MTGKPRAIAAGALAVAIVGGVIAVVDGRDTGERPAQATGVQPLVAVLREDNVLLVLDARGRVVGRRRLGVPPASPLGARYLAVDGDGDLRIVVSGATRDQLVHATPRGRVRGRLDLPAGVRYRALVIGKTGRVYLAGERTSNQRTEFGGNAKSAVLTVLGPSGELVATETLRRPGAGEPTSGPLDWQIYDLAVAESEDRVFVSYHGPNTDGADAVEVDGARLIRCGARTFASGCIEPVHGSIEADGDDVLAALGTPPQVARLTADGKTVRVWRSGFERAHLVEFALREQSLFSIESCAKTGGMAVVDLETNATRVLQREAEVAPPQGLGARAVCGERISAGRAPLIAVMKRGTITGIGGVILLDLKGQVASWSRLEPAPVDVLVVPQP